MAAEKSRAIVLRSFPFGETSCVVVLYCRDFGKVRALAKGAWRPKSGFDGGLDLLSVSQVLVLRKSSGGLDLLTEAALERRFRVGTSLAAVLGGLHVAELLDALTADADPQPELFDVAYATLSRLSAWQGDEALLPGIVLAAELALLRLTGHGPELHACVECRADVPAGGRVAFGMLDGGTLCPRCRAGRRGVVSISAAGIAALRSLAAAPRSGAMPELPSAVAGEARSIMTTCISHLLGRQLRVPPDASRTAARRRSR